MQAVIYTHQLEPITVVDIPMKLWDMLYRGDMIVLPVTTSSREWTTDPTVTVKLVRIHGEVFARRQHRSMMLFTHDEEHALQLRAAFLPGQIATTQLMHRRAFAEGFITALRNYE